jgi:hypothetical protein
MATTRKTTARNTTPRKTAAKKTPAQKTAAKKTAARKSAAPRAAAARDQQPEQQPGQQPEEQQPEQQKARPRSLRSVAIGAARELSELIGQMPEGIVAVEKRDDGWLVKVEVVEAHRIPETTDILAVYDVEVGDDGAVTGYRRADRYVRGRVQE